MITRSLILVLAGSQTPSVVHPILQYSSLLSLSIRWHPLVPPDPRFQRLHCMIIMNDRPAAVLCPLTVGSMFLICRVRWAKWYIRSLVLRYNLFWVHRREMAESAILSPLLILSLAHCPSSRNDLPILHANIWPWTRFSEALNFGIWSRDVETHSSSRQSELSENYSVWQAALCHRRNPYLWTFFYFFIFLIFYCI